ncbi:MAG: tetratricopeptide repeat protein [Lysobacter spongiicola]|nr:tetratricopeptide repeat protein [Lysobacter spongiicola]
MTVFVIASVLLVLLVASYVLRPLWQARPIVGGAVVLAVAIGTGLMYMLVGTPGALDPARRAAPETLSDAVVQLEAELERDPNQVEGWRLLGRAYLAEQRPADARDALARAVKLAPDEPTLLVEAAEARAMANEDRRFDAAAIGMLEHALAVEPAHQRARWFLGIAQRQRGDAAAAATTWEPLLARVDPATAPSLREQINLARADAGLEPLAETADAAGPPVSITVSISLDPALAMQFPDNASIFVIARQPDGSPVPVAAKKLPAASFPLRVTLSDADSLMPTQKLSDLEQVRLSARISASGDATAKPGDFESEPVLVDVSPDAAAALMVDRVVQ